MTVLYVKNNDGFSVVDVEKLAEARDLQKGIIVYDPTSETMAPQYLIQVGGEICLYNSRRIQNEYSLMRDWCKKYNSEKKEWEEHPAAPRLQSNLQPLSPLSDAEKITLTHYHYTQQLKQNIQSALEVLRAAPDANPQDRQSVRDQIAKQYTQYMIDQLEKLMRDLSLEKCEMFLKSHWEKIKGTVLCYTALPNHPATLALCDIAEKLADRKNVMARANNFSAIALLMPGIFTASQFEGSFKNLDKINIHEILKTHILSEDHRYLLPVKLFAQSLPSEPEDENNGAAAPAAAAGIYPYIAITDDFKKILNPYWAEEYKPPADGKIPGCLSQSELQRLAPHNDYTKTILDSKKEYDEISHDQSTLLGKLNRLIQELQGASAHGGRGQQKVAAIGAFPAIVAFNSYYETLTSEQKQEIPKEVNELIKTLIELATTKQKDYEIRTTQETPSDITPGIIYITKKENQFCYSIWTHKGETIKEAPLILDKLPKNATLDQIKQYKDDILTYLAKQKHIPESKQFFVSQAELMQTCIGNQSSFLKSSVSKHNSALIKIGLSSENKQIILDRIKDQYIANQTQLKRDELDNSRDDFGIGETIINLLKVPIDELISNDNTLKEFMLLEPDELNALLQKPEIQLQILTVINSLGNWVLFIINNLPDKIKIVLHALAERFCRPQNGVIKTSANLSELLISLTDEKCHAVCHALKDQLPKIIKSGEDFRKALSNLSIEQCTAVFKACKDQLPNIIKSSFDFWNALECLTKEQCTAVCSALKDQLPRIIKNSRDFLQLLIPLTKERCTVVCEAYKDQLPSIVTNGGCFDFGWALSKLSVEQCTGVFSALKDQLPKIIKDSCVFWRVLHNLCEASRTVVYEAYQDQLPSIIKSSDDFRSVLQFLTKEQRTAVYEACKGQLPNIIQEVRGFWEVLKYLSVEQCTAVCSAVKNKFQEIIKDAQNLKQLIDMLFKKEMSNYQKIDLLYALFDNVSPNAECYKFALDDFTQKILTILDNTQPQEIQQQQFQKAEQIVLRQIAPGVQFFGSPNAPASYLKHKNYWDEKKQQQSASPRLLY